MTQYAFNSVSNPNPGLGDCLSCFNTHLPIWSPSPHFNILRKYSSIPFIDNKTDKALDTTLLVKDDFGKEHLFNRVRIVTGLSPLEEPKAILNLIKYSPIKNNIAFSFDVGNHAQHQKHLHPRARELYPEHRETIQEFISANKDLYNFIEFGLISSGFNDSTKIIGVSLDKTVEEMSKCQYYFGMHSGLMHLATAIGLRSTIIINFPTIERINLLELPFKPNDPISWEKSWLYPQHRYLHEDHATDEYSITRENLELIWK